ncbi:MAG: YfhO family protein [Chitinophagaceae bacterium]
MNKDLLRKILPHIIAFLVFLIVAVIYCKPALEGKVLYQQDITQWKGSVHESEVFKEKHGHLPLWTNSMFSGMPTFQISAPSNNVIPGYIHAILTLGLPAPIQFFFLACICFYFLCIVLRVNPYIGILGGLAFAYATYDPVIIVAGHVTKMWSIAYMPALLGSMILIFQKKYWTGAALTALFASVMIAMNHPQIDYYFFLTVGIMIIFYVAYWIKNKEWKHMILALVFLGAGTLIGVLENAVTLLSTYEYQKETIRGGGSVLTDTTQTGVKSQTGLDKDYAFRYSASITEPLVMMVPRMLGGSAGSYEEVPQEDSKAVQAISALPKELQQQLSPALRYYWGGISYDGNFGGTAGPPYAGAIICFLAIMAFFVIDKKYKWWMLTAIILAVLMSWGSYFEAFNDILYNYFPFYNKFRAPSMTLVIPQLLLPILAVLCVNAFVTSPDKKTLLPAFKKGLIATCIVFVILFMLYFSFSYLAQGDSNILKRARDAQQPQLYDAVKSFFDGLIADRKGLMLGDIFRSLGFIAVAAAILFLLIRNTLKPLLATILLTAFVFIDLIVIDNHYLNSDNFQEKSENENSFQLTKADQDILADKSFFRVINVSGDPFTDAVTSYNYNSVGGYHAVKLRLYQDIIEHQFSRQPSQGVIDMLNVKYFIQKDNQGLTQQYQKNPGALGPCWLAGNISFVKTPDAEMAALDHFNPKDTAIVNESFKSSIPFMPVADSAATITLVSNENDLINYDFNAASNQFAVFSEVYYKSGWKAFIDGKESPIIKTDYVLRGLAVPAGKHKIEFKFEPKGYMTGKMITSVFTIIMIVLIAIAIFMGWKQRKTVSRQL